MAISLSQAVESVGVVRIVPLTVIRSKFGAKRRKIAVMFVFKVWGLIGLLIKVWKFFLLCQAYWSVVITWVVPLTIV